MDRNLNRRGFLKSVGLTAAALTIPGCVSSARELTSRSPRGPNIVFVMADDMGYGDVSCYNAESKIPTPNIDRLAKQGIRFTDAHSPSAVCTPTRYGVLTGRYCWRTWLKSGVVGGYTSPLIEPGSTSDEVICLTDLIATCAVVVGAELPDGAGPDSFNILPALLGRELNEPIRPAIIHHSVFGVFSIRRGKWKLILETKTSGGWVRPSGKRPTPGTPGQLYNLQEDLYERNDLWNEYPQVVERLTKLLEKYKEQGHSKA